jgi:hypothetical protein
MWRWGFAVALGVGAVVLAGCQSSTAGTAETAPPVLSTAGTEAPTPSRGGVALGPNTLPPAPSPPSPPSAADGSDIDACSDARCEVSVGAGTAVPVPESTGVRDLKVTAVTADRVTLTGKDTGNYSSSACEGQCDSDDTNGAFTIMLGTNGRDLQNGLSITVEGIGDGKAVLKLDVAS